MPRIRLTAYDPLALVYDRREVTFALGAGFDPRRDEIEMIVTPGTTGGPSPVPVASIVTPADRPRISGVVDAVPYARLRAPDGPAICLDRIEIDGRAVGYASSRPLLPGLSYADLTGDDVPGAPAHADSAGSCTTHDLPGFASDALVATGAGLRRADSLREGDMVLTHDNGLQPVRWILHHRMPAGTLATGPGPASVQLAPGAVSAGRPEQPLIVSGSLRIQIREPMAELLFGEPQVFAQAGRLADGGAIAALPAGTSGTVVQLLFDAHELVQANGLWVESLWLGEPTLRALPPMARVIAQQIARGLSDRPCLARLDLAPEEILCLYPQRQRQRERRASVA